jgi:hypothetical protein
MVLALGQLLHDFAKLLLGEVHQWTSKKEASALTTAQYINDVSLTLEAYVQALNNLDDDDARREGTTLRFNLDQTLENLAYTLDGRVDDHLLQQLLKTLQQGKVTDGLLIPAIGSPKAQLQKLSVAERREAIDDLSRAAGEFRSIARTLAVRANIDQTKLGKT